MKSISWSSWVEEVRWHLVPISAVQVGGCLRICPQIRLSRSLSVSPFYRIEAPKAGAEATKAAAGAGEKRLEIKHSAAAAASDL